MNNPSVPESPSDHALELFQPSPNALYTLDAVAHLSGVPRRSILVFCRAGLLSPIFLPPYGVMEFTDDAIYTVRRIEAVKAAHEHGVTWLQTMFALMNEVERLRAEVHFVRSR